MVWVADLIAALSLPLTGQGILLMTLYCVTYSKTPWVSGLLHFLPSHLLLNPREPEFHPQHSREILISKWQITWTFINTTVNSLSSVYLIGTLLINLLLLKHLFHLASGTPISLLLHYWQLHHRLFFWFIWTSETWSTPHIRLLCFLTITFFVISRLTASASFFMQTLPIFYILYPWGRLS